MCEFVIFSFSKNSNRCHALIVETPSKNARYIGTNGKYYFYYIPFRHNAFSYEAVKV